MVSVLNVPQCLLCDKCILWIKIFPFKVSLLELFQTKEDSLVRISRILSVWITATIHFACFWHSSQLKSLTLAFPPEQNTCPLVKIQSHVTIWASTQCPKFLHFRYVGSSPCTHWSIDFAKPFNKIPFYGSSSSYHLPPSRPPLLFPFFRIHHQMPSLLIAVPSIDMQSWKQWWWVCNWKLMILFPPKQPSHVSDKGETNWTLADQVKRSCRGKRSLILGSTQNYSCPSMYR